jgi:hypothetical protein
MGAHNLAAAAALAAEERTCAFGVALLLVTMGNWRPGQGDQPGMLPT